MPNAYQIIVENQSGRPQSYALVNQAPEYVGTGGPKIWSNVVSDSTLEPDDSTNFEISTQYRAFFGTSRGKLGERVSIQVAGSVPVTLGQQNNDGTVLLGTTVKLIAGPGGFVPSFSRGQNPSNGSANCFEILTDHYNRDQAIQGNWVVGLARDTGDRQGTPLATISAEPGQSFQIRPSNTWWVIPGRFETGYILDNSNVGLKATINMSEYPSGRVRVVHGEDGRLKIVR